MKSIALKSLTKIGFINKISGFKGNVNCIIDAIDFDSLLKKKFLFVLQEGLPVPYAIEDIEQKGNETIVKFEDIDSEVSAKQLLRKDLYSEMTGITDSPDELSWNNLIGYEAIDEHRGSIGKIAEILEYPLQFIARCLVGEKEILFPLNDDFIIEIDEENQILHIDLPDGLLDIYLK